MCGIRECQLFQLGIFANPPGPASAQATQMSSVLDLEPVPMVALPRRPVPVYVHRSHILPAKDIGLDQKRKSRYT